VLLVHVVCMRSFVKSNIFGALRSAALLFAGNDPSVRHFFLRSVPNRYSTGTNRLVIGAEVRCGMNSSEIYLLYY
jgi:hypothetical protein